MLVSSCGDGGIGLLVTFVHDGRGQFSAASPQIVEAIGLFGVEHAEGPHDCEAFLCLLAGVREDGLRDRAEENGVAGFFALTDVATGIPDRLVATPPPRAKTVLHSRKGQDQDVDSSVGPQAAQAQRRPAVWVQRPRSSPRREAAVLEGLDDLTRDVLADLVLAGHRVVPFELLAFGTTMRQVSFLVPGKAA